MGILEKITHRLFGTKANFKSSEQEKKALLRRCYFEVMEQRRVLSADPVIAAVTYLEGDAGQDTTPDHFEVTFEGGAETTELTEFTINGDQDASGGLSNGDMFFDVNGQVPGAGGYHPFLFDSAHSSGLTESDVTGFSVSEDGLELTVQLKNFEAGDVFAFTIDVDEVERFRADKIASGVEFEGTAFSASFVDQHYSFEQQSVSLDVSLEDGYVQLQREGVFYDEYDHLLGHGETVANHTIELTLDNENGNSNRTAGAVDAYDLVAKPVSISGTIYHDEDLNCEHDPNEGGIEGVPIELQRLNETSGLYETVASTSTDANGAYQFGEDLGLMPGKFKLVETQPDGYLDLGVVVGSEGGDSVQGPNGQTNEIANIDIPLGATAATDYDFKEVKPVSLSGNVWHDQNNDGVFDPGEQGIANVLIQVNRLEAKSGVVEEPFAGMTPIMVRTDIHGHYSVEGLPPGVYEVVEVNNYPVDEINPLGEFIDGKDSIGQVNGTPAGKATNDRISQIELCAGEEGHEFNFGELRAAQIGGYVSVATPEGECLDPTDSEHVGISGVTIELYDSTGSLVASTATDATGHYLFDNLAPATYTVVEVQPDGYLDGNEGLGMVDGVVAGSTLENDRFSSVVLSSGNVGTNYNFCEHVPAELSGTVWHDLNDNGSIDVGEDGIGDVRIELFDQTGAKIAETTTDASGRYQFNDLYAGEYLVKESQPDGFEDGKESLGFIDGRIRGTLPVSDVFSVTLTGGAVGTEFNFGELRFAEIGGTIHLDANGNCVFEPSAGDQPIAGATLELLDSNGTVIATTETDSDGNYRFTQILPGTYSIREIQPEDFFNGGERVGNGGGTTLENLIDGIVIQSGQTLTHYDFCEVNPAEIHGRVWEDGPGIETEGGLTPTDYRNLRDGVFQSDVDTPLEGVRMQLYFFVDIENDSPIPRPVTLGDVQSGFYDHLGTDDLSSAIWVETTATGEYSFRGLPAGNYIIFETQPDGFVDGNDTPGTTTGASYNAEADLSTAPEFMLRQFSIEQMMDSIVNVRVNGGDISVENNFSEISMIAAPIPPVDTPPLFSPDVPTGPVVAAHPNSLQPGITSYPWLSGSQPGIEPLLLDSTSGVLANGSSASAFTWHLSVVNAGLPRGLADGSVAASVWQQAGYLSNSDWNRFKMDDAVWTFTQSRGPAHDFVRTSDDLRFGMIGGTPVAGDFDGDGTDEVAVFKDGYWMIDLNRNGIWDDGDLMIRLGAPGDRPVVGDWDGDGKDDIGIYGPIWEGDWEAISQDPGLPNPDNMPFTRPKNVPPVDDSATGGARVMKLTSFGKQRADVVDHVFGIGNESEIPVTGDWNGNGIRSIGTFRDGVWELDVNGDGRFDHHDKTARFGRAGDLPLVGDFNGDGVDEIAIYRSGTWMIDSNGNHELEATDKTFEMGGSADQPVVGDWDGDGIDEPGLYTESPGETRFN